MNLATTVVVQGLHGWLLVIACVVFAIATVIAFVKDGSPRVYWPTLIALGLTLWTLDALIH